jgi:hypothetical protein
VEAARASGARPCAGGGAARVGLFRISWVVRSGGEVVAFLYNCVKRGGSGCFTRLINNPTYNTNYII